LTNGSNDLEDAELIASIPLPDTAWKDVIVPESERANVTFDRNSNKIRWRVGNLPAFTGKFIPARTLTFHLEVIPGLSDQNTSISLIKDVATEGRDAFVDQIIKSVTVNDYRTTDLDDPAIEQHGGTVK
jgi:hypothetical protein